MAMLVAVDLSSDDDTVDSKGLISEEKRPVLQVEDDIISLFDRIRSDIQLDNIYRENSLSLTASENYPSRLVRILGSALQGGFYEFSPPYDSQPGEWFFPDSGALVSIKNKLAALAKELFQAQTFDWRPNGGSVAEQAMLLGCCPRGSGFVHFAHKDGGHFALEQLAQSLGVNTYSLPIIDRTLQIDVDRLGQMVRSHPEIRLVILDQSFKLRWQPLAEIRACLPDSVVLAYDASHDGALIAGGQVPQPLMTGADALIGNTHKTIPGPQKGYIAFKSENHPQAREVADWVCPKLQSNSHAECMLPMYMAFTEMAHFGRAYAAMVIQNAKALAKALVSEGFQVSGEQFGYTETHQIHIILGSFARSLEAATDLLPSAGMRVTNIEIPGSNGQFGLRLGTQALTRRGMQPSVMPEIAKLMARVLIRKQNVREVRDDVAYILSHYPVTNLHYCFDDQIQTGLADKLLGEVLR